MSPRDVKMLGILHRAAGGLLRVSCEDIHLRYDLAPAMDAIRNATARIKRREKKEGFEEV